MRRIPRSLPRSLHGRMLLVSACATLVALLLAGASIAGLLGRFVMEGLDRRLDSEVTLLASAIGPDGRVDRTRIADRIDALESGPGWRWRIEGPDGAIGSADFPVLDRGPPAGPHGPRPREGEAREGEGEDAVAVHARELTIATSRGPVTLTAAAPRAVVQRPIRGALVPLLGMLAGLAALLTAAMLVQLRVGLRPLHSLRDEVAAIRRGARARVDEDQPTELRPLAIELNALAADNAATLATARATAANLAHALKTPVAKLAIDLRDQPDAAAQVARIDRTIRHHLARARATAVDRRSSTTLRPAIDDIVAAVRRIHRDRALAFAIEVDAAAVVAVDTQDLDELLGNLIENAARHATGRVAIGAERDGRHVRLTIADDGPGIPADARARVMSAGTRLDERGDGHGFGLSIVAELVGLYGGTFALADATGGGLVAELRLPAAG